METKKKILDQESIMKMLDSIYEKCLNGIPKVSKSVEELSNDYLQKNPNNLEAGKALIKNQVIKCTTSGFLSGLGGIVTLPVMVPANVGSVLYVQMRMISAIAYLAGYDLNDDQTQTFIYACLANVAVADILKQAGIKFGVKLSNSMIKKIPGKVLTKINQKVGFRFITKFGTKGIVNLGKMVPLAGAVIGGGIDLAETKAMGNRAIRQFFDGDFFSDDKNNSSEDFVAGKEDYTVNDQ